MNRLTRTAYHEAGHVIEAWRLGLSVERATIADDGLTGHVDFQSTPHFIPAESSKSEIKDIEQQIVILLSGRFAEWRAAGRQVISRAAATEAISHSLQGLRCGRIESLTIHRGRHTLISHALAGGRSLPEVRDAVAHCNVSITSGYRHVAVDDDAKVGIAFRFRS